MVAQKDDFEDTIPTIDEDWWDSLLAEDERYDTPVPSVPKASSAKDRDEEQKSNWNEVRDLYHEDQIVQLQVTGFNRGGVLVEGDGLYGFVPYSHLVDMSAEADTNDRDKTLNEYVGRELNLKVIECAPEDGRVVFSERAALSEPGQRKNLFQNLEPNQRVIGKVTNITDFGAFVDLGGVEGLIHISELSWGRVSHPSQIVELGEKIEAQVLEISPERCRVALSLKRIQPNPWERAEKDFSVGKVLSATITNVVSFGAFARLEAGVEGLIHASEIPLNDGENIRDVLVEGQQVQVRVLHVNSSRQRMGLSMFIEEAIE
jgi:small subunit ribosomal protein S1